MTNQTMKCTSCIHNAVCALKPHASDPAAMLRVKEGCRNFRGGSVRSVYSGRLRHCGSCLGDIKIWYKYCPSCGTKIEWR